MNKKKSLFLIDGSALFYRAYFAFIKRPLINSKGENTSATFGFIHSLLKIYREENPDYLAVIFDTKEPTFRHEMYKEYKANREAMPDDLVYQLPRIRKAVEVMNIAHYELAGFEADDIIGTYARRGGESGLDVYIATNDKDCFQLVNENVKIYYNSSRDDSIVKMGPEEVKIKFGVYPEHVIDKLALMGDSSDNVPGVRGVGPKSADALLEQFGNLESVLKRHDEIKAKGLREKISSSIKQAELSKVLVTIDCNVPIEFDIGAMKRREINKEETREFLEELEHKRLLKLLITDDGQPTEQTETVNENWSNSKYVAVKTIAELKKLVTALKKKKIISVDTETTSLDTMQAKLVGFSLSAEKGTGYYLPVGHTGKGEQNLPLDETIQILKGILEDEKIAKVGQNLKYDIEVLKKYKLTITPVSFDTMLASYLLNPSLRQNSLDALAQRLLGYKMQPISDLIGRGRNQTTFDTVPIDRATFYAAEDADVTFQVMELLKPELKKNKLENLFYEIELPLINVLADIETAGVNIDVPFLAKLSRKSEKSIDKLKLEIYEINGGEFNINSTQQLSHLLFEKLSLPTLRKTAKKTGYSTDVRVLEELSGLHPLPNLLLEYRRLAKLKSTYIDAIPKLINPDTKRVHTDFNQTIAATGRLSSNNPNLQNIPIRTKEGREIRKAFIPRDSDHLLLTADYSQIELRILAHYANDPVLIKAFKKNEDIHLRTAAEVFNVDIKEVTADQRRSAKTANFAIIYGVSAFGLTQQSDMNMNQAKEFIKTYFEKYSGIKDYMEEYKQFARDNGFVTTLFDRKRYIPDINNKNHTVRQFAERVAINTPIQGTAADMIKIAMINIHNKMSKMKSKMILQVHDELVFDVYKPEMDDLKSIVKDGMENVTKLKVPIVADISYGENWLDAK